MQGTGTGAAFKYKNGRHKSIIEAGLPGKISYLEMCCYIHIRTNGNPPTEPIPVSLDYEMCMGFHLGKV
jgi:hypothetical protein